MTTTEYAEAITALILEAAPGLYDDRPSIREKPEYAKTVLRHPSEDRAAVGRLLTQLGFKRTRREAGYSRYDHADGTSAVVRVERETEIHAPRVIS